MIKIWFEEKFEFSAVYSKFFFGAAQIGKLFLFIIFSLYSPCHEIKNIQSDGQVSCFCFLISMKKSKVYVERRRFEEKNEAIH